MYVNEYATFDRTIQWKQVDGVIVLTIQDYLDAVLAPKLEVAFKELLKKPNLPIVIDGTHWQLVTPTGLQVFLKFIQNLKTHKWCMALANPTNLMRAIWNLSGFQAVAPLYDTVKQAIRACSLANRPHQLHTKPILPHI